MLNYLNRISQYNSIKRNFKQIVHSPNFIEFGFPFLFVIFAGFTFLFFQEGWLNPDQSLYLKEALRISRGYGYSYILRPPLLPLTIALLFRLFGSSIFLGHLIIRLIYIGLLAELYILFSKMFDRKVGYLGVILILGSSFFLKSTTYLLPDGLLAFNMILSLIFIYYAIEAKGVKSRLLWIIAGISIAASFYTKQTGIIWILLPPLLLIIKPKLRATNKINVLLWISCLIGLVAVWWIYYYIKTGQIYLLSTSEFIPGGSLTQPALGDSLSLLDKFEILVNGILHIVYSSWEYALKYFPVSFKALPLFIVAWLFSIYMAIKGNWPDMLLNLAFIIYFVPTLAYLGPRSGIDSVRNFLPLIVLLYGICAHFLISVFQWIVQLQLWPEYWKRKIYILGLMGIFIPAVIVAAYQHINFVIEQNKTDNNLTLDGTWYNNLVVDSSDWIKENIPTGAKIMSTWLWADQIYFDTDGNYDFSIIPIKKLKHDPSAAKDFFVQNGLWGEINNELRKRPQSESNLLYLEKRVWSDYYIGLWEYDLIQDIKNKQIEYLIFTGDSYYNPLSLLSYFDQNPGFQEIYSLINKEKGINFEVHIFKVFFDGVTYLHYPLTISPSTLMSYLNDYSNGGEDCFDRLSKLGSSGFLVQPVVYKNGYIDTQIDITNTQDLIQSCVKYYSTHNPDSSQAKIILEQLSIEQKHYQDVLDMATSIDTASLIENHLYLAKQLARLALLKGNKELAMNTWTDIAKYYPYDSYAWMMLGIISEENGQDTLAFNYYLLGEKAEPENVANLAQLSLLYERGESPNKSDFYWKNIIDLTKNTNLPYLKLANLFYETNTVYNFISLAEKSHEEFSPTFFLIDGLYEKVLYMHPPNEESFIVKIPNNGLLQFSLAIAPEVWNINVGDGVLYEVYLQDDASTYQIYSEYIDPKINPDQRHWLSRSVDLSHWGGEEVKLFLKTSPGPNDDLNYDWAGWGEPRIVVPVKYDFLSGFNLASKETESPGELKLDQMSINNLVRPVIYAHPYSSITYDVVLNAKLSLGFGIGMDPSVWAANKGDGVDFYVYVVLAEEPNKIYLVFHRYLDPKNHPEDRQWVDVKVRLNQFEGKRVLIKFVTTAGPNHNSDFDWVAWSRPILLNDFEDTAK